MTNPSHVAVIISALQSFFGSDITGITPTPVRDSATFPLITVQEIMFNESQDLQGGQGLGDSIIQLNCWSKDYEEANDIRTRARKYLNSFYGTVLGIEIQGITHRNDAELYDGVRELHQCITRLNVWFTDTADRRKFVFGDSFQRDDSLSLGSNWIELEEDPREIQIKGGVLHVGGGGYFPAVTYHQAIALFNNAIGDNQFSELVIKATGSLAAAEAAFGIMCRASKIATIPGSVRGYNLDLFAQGSAGRSILGFNILRIDDSLHEIITDLYDYPSNIFVNDGDVFRLEVIGPVINVKYNGTLLASVTDPTYSSGSVGMGAYTDSDQEMQFYSWSGGEL